MNELIKHFADLMNINITSKHSIDSMMEDMEGVKDLDEFRKYIKSNENYFGLDFKTGLQKFTILAKQYKDKKNREENAERLENGNKFANELALKVSVISMEILNFQIPEGKKDLSFHNFKLHEKDYFSAYEVKTLKKIGTLRASVMLQRSQSGVNKLYEKIVEIISNKILIEDKTKKIGGAAPSIKLPNIKRF